jgi:hypothetical protein
VEVQLDPKRYVHYVVQLLVVLFENQGQLAKIFTTLFREGANIRLSDFGVLRFVVKHLE